MAFMICFTDRPNEYLDDDPSVPSAVGRIVAGDLDESFVSSLYEWDRQAYQSHWRSSLDRFLNGDDKAVLITWYVNPGESSNLQWWALYRGKDDIVHVQNHLPFYDILDAEFCVENASSFLKDRETATTDGNPISEWDVSIREIELFVAQLNHQPE